MNPTSDNNTPERHRSGLVDVPDGRQPRTSAVQSNHQFPLTNLNDTTGDLPTMYGTLVSSAMGDDLAKFITMYRILGPSELFDGRNPIDRRRRSGPFWDGGGGGNTAAAAIPRRCHAFRLVSNRFDENPQDTNQVSIRFDQCPSVGQHDEHHNVYPGRGKTTDNHHDDPTVYSSPLSDPGQQAMLLPFLFQSVTIWTTPEIPARINLTQCFARSFDRADGGRSLSTSDVQAVLSAQPQYDNSSTNAELYQTPAWLISQASISPSKLSKMDQYVTTNSQVFRVQSIGYSDLNKGQTARIEAVFDANYYIPNANGVAQPRLLRWRIMDDFGKFKPPSNN